MVKLLAIFAVGAIVGWIINKNLTLSVAWGFIPSYIWFVVNDLRKNKEIN